MHRALPTDPHRTAPIESPTWRDRLTLLLESTGDGIFGVDLDGRCVFANRAASRLLGHPVDALLGRNMHALIHHSHPDGDPYPDHCCPIFRAFRSGESCRVDSDVLWRADGTSFPAEYASNPIVENGVVRGAVVTFVDISERKRAERLLHEANAALEERVASRTRELSDALAALRRLSAHAHAVREHERTRIAREIHDEFGSLLVGLRLDVAWLRARVDERPELSAKCRAMSRTIESAVGNVGRIITDLRPSLLDHQGLAAALEWLCSEFERTTELACDSRIALPADAQATFSEALSTALFRIAQELLSNVARHARATRVTVDVSACDGRLAIVVVDDGRGAPRAAFEAPTAYGVRGLRERVGHFGGTVAIDSRPDGGTAVDRGGDGTGTRVVVTVPLPSIAYDVGHRPTEASGVDA